MNTVPAVLLEADTSIARITLNRPAAGNAIDLEMSGALLQTARELQALQNAGNTNVRALLLSGAGPRFCVGGSIDAFLNAREQLPALIRDLTSQLHEAMLCLLALQLPIIVAVQGAAAGAGLGLALLGDWIVAGRGTKFRSGYTALGFTGDAGITYSLPRRVGTQAARRLMMRNLAMDASEALHCGLIDEQAIESELTAVAERAATELASGSLPAFARLRALLDASVHSSFEQQLQLEARAMIDAASSTDVHEAIAAFSARRQPKV